MGKWGERGKYYCLFTGYESDAETSSDYATFRNLSTTAAKMRNGTDHSGEVNELFVIGRLI